jgi:ABC-type transport system involved in multi-copper enzyme maturation permease subunit
MADTTEPTTMADATESVAVDVTGTAEAGVAGSTVASAVARRRLRRPHPVRALRGALAGMTAIGVKELRGRMRGRRAFVILTVYLVLLAGFAWMMALILEREYAAALGGSAAFASAQIGRGVFGALLILETVLVVALAPAFTAGAISLEREKQTLDMLAATPISSLALVLGKLISALTYVFILIVASIPLTAIVFVFGGVSPDDVVRGYLVLIATALGMGSIGLFFSALIRRTQAATIATYFAVLAVTAGTFFVSYFWNAMTGASDVAVGTREFGPLRGRPPEALQYLNPYFAQADILCSVEDGFGEWCNRVAFIGARGSVGVIVSPPKTEPGIDVGFGVGRNGVVIVPGLKEAPLVDVVGVEPFGVVRDGFWPKSALAWLVLSAVLLVASVQLVAPTRRWRPRLPWPGRLRRPARRVSR